MSSDNKTILYDQFIQYHKKAKDAESVGEYKRAKKLYALSCKSLMGLAQRSEGEYAEAYKNKVDTILDKAAALPDNDEIQPIDNKAFKPNAVAKHSPAPPVEAKSSDDETQFYAATIPDITFDDVAGLTDVKESINTRIIKPRQYPAVYKALKKKPGGGVLMYGPPGTGKTMIAKAIANEVGAVFFDVKCSSIVQKYFGVAERNVKNLFETARKHEVAIIFFDEFDSLAAKRGGGSTVMDRIVPELLAQIDGFTSNSNTLMLIAATNRPWTIDSAFLRPGRFSELLPIPLPDKEARLHIINNAFYGVPIEKGINLEALAERMEGFNGADVVEFCGRCKDPAADRCISQYDGDLDGLIITAEDIDITTERIKSSVQPNDLADLENFKNQYQKM